MISVQQSLPSNWELQLWVSCRSLSNVWGNSLLFSFCLTFESMGQQYLLSITLSKDLISLLSFDAGRSRAGQAPLGQARPALKFSLQLHFQSLLSIMKIRGSPGPPTDSRGPIRSLATRTGPMGVQLGRKWGTQLRELYGWSLPSLPPSLRMINCARAHTRLFALTTNLALSVWIEN